LYEKSAERFQDISGKNIFVDKRLSYSIQFTNGAGNVPAIFGEGEGVKIKGFTSTKMRTGETKRVFVEFNSDKELFNWISNKT
jgi:hypothetical protein